MLLHYASLAGSSHNSQPWKTVVYRDDSILVYACTSRTLPVVDKTKRELYISIGAFIENLTIAADCYGFQTTTRIYPASGNNEEPVACVKLSRSCTKLDGFSLTDIEMRTTLRVPFNTDPINAPDWEKLVCHDTSDIHFIPAETTEGMLLAKREYEAYALQSHNEKASDELAGWIRFSDKDVKEKRDGLTTAGMAIKGLGRFIVKTFFKPEDSKKESFVSKGIEKTKREVENCGGWIIITRRNNDIEDWLMAGRLYERVNLSCRKLNIGFHPMNQIIEEDSFERLLDRDLKLNGEIMFVARIGYVNDYPQPVSLRRPVESFCVFK